jgi:DNA-binding SARP family transcriptional activator
VDFSILGHLRIVDGDRPIGINGSSQIILLQTLLVSRNGTVTSDVLMEEMWGQALPANASAALQAQLSRIRKKLGSASTGEARILRRTGGYELVLRDCHVDADEFREAVRRWESDDTSLSERASGLRGALAMWRGPVFGGTPGGPVCQAFGIELDEIRVRALERLFDAEIDNGRHSMVIGELRSAVIRYPLRERFCQQLMTALYRAGRQTEALAVYRDLRQRLAENLGVDPSPDLRELEKAVLSHDSELQVANNRRRAPS